MLAEIFVLPNWSICSLVFAVMEKGKYICMQAVSQLLSWPVLTTFTTATALHVHQPPLHTPLPTYTNTTAPSCDTHTDVLGQQKQVYVHTHTHHELSDMGI